MSDGVVVTVAGDGPHHLSASVPVGDHLVVRLPEIPTTGYRWDLAGDPGPVLGVAGSQLARRAAGIGGGGTRELRFTAEEPGSVALHLRLARAWAPEDAEDERWIDVTVELPPSAPTSR